MIAPHLPHLSVVIPAFNEEQRIADSLRAITHFLDGEADPYEVIVVDDGSTDSTSSIVERLQKMHRSIRLIRIEHAGKGWAVRTGMLNAQGRLRYMCDTDLSTPIEELPRFLEEAAKGCEVALGSREAKGARRIDEPWRRHFLGRVFNKIVQLIVSLGIDDTQCGFKLFSARAADTLFARQTLPGFGFDVEILFLARRVGLSLSEVPVTWHYKTGSKVHPLRDSLRMLRDVLKIRWNSWSGQYQHESPPETAETPRKATQARPTETAHRPEPAEPVAAIEPEDRPLRPGPSP